MVRTCGEKDRGRCSKEMMENGRKWTMGRGRAMSYEKTYGRQGHKERTCFNENLMHQPQIGKRSNKKKTVKQLIIKSVINTRANEKQNGIAWLSLQLL